MLVNRSGISGANEFVACPDKHDQKYCDTKNQQRNTDAKGMVKYGEAFFTSLGLPALPDSFWQRSLFTRPQDREVVCHASAWDLDNKDDVRIKMWQSPRSSRS